MLCYLYVISDDQVKQGCQGQKMSKVCINPVAFPEHLSFTAIEPLESMGSMGEKSESLQGHMIFSLEAQEETGKVMVFKDVLQEGLVGFFFIRKLCIEYLITQAPSQ